MILCHLEMAVLPGWMGQKAQESLCCFADSDARTVKFYQIWYTMNYYNWKQRFSIRITRTTHLNYLIQKMLTYVIAVLFLGHSKLLAQGDSHKMDYTALGTHLQRLER